MAILKDTLVQGDLVVTGNMRANSITSDTSGFIFIIGGTYQSGTGITNIDKTYAQIQDAISDGKTPIIIADDGHGNTYFYYPYHDNSGQCIFYSSTGNTAEITSGGTINNDLSNNATWATVSSLSSKANTASPTLTGTPKAPTAAATTNNTQIATTAFVKTVINRTTAVSAADTNYTTYMARGMALNTSDTNPTVNGAISWTYK